MENVGTWNSDYAILFFGALIAPFFLYFLGRLFNDFIFVERPIVENQPPLQKTKKKEQEGSQITIKFEEAITRHKRYCPQYDPDLPPPSKTPRRTTMSKDGGKTWTDISERYKNCRQDKIFKDDGTIKKDEYKKRKKAEKLNTIQEEAVSALGHMGLNRRSAKKLVLSLYEKKNYDSLDSLIRDCLKRD